MCDPNRDAVGYRDFGKDLIRSIRQTIKKNDWRAGSEGNVPGGREVGKDVVDTFYGNKSCAAYSDFHEDVRAVLTACPDCHKWAILERDPLPHWSDGYVVLLGDACHPMTPYMAQGAATSIEDAAVLARCLEESEGDDIGGAFRRYEAHRKPRTSVVQAISSANTWMREGSGDTSWLYGYDAWTAPLNEPAPHAAAA